ncbi:GMC oxidoreductase [Earliella scabrosa]|nr:GMC oxidoreductase [Earliella scabrosa]
MTTPDELTSQPYDYIIVGGGTAGLPVAVRLSEDPSVTVAVIEAGDWHATVDGINIPGMAGQTLMKPELDWAFMSVPQKYANNRPIYQPRGKGLGGSSGLNFLGNTRAGAAEYDAIEALGNPGWNWQEFLKYFKKSETTLPVPTDLGPEYKLVEPNPKWHGDSGPLKKGYPHIYAAHHIPFTEAFEEIGVPRNPDPYGGSVTGCATVFACVDSSTGTRSYSGSAYYAPNADRKNLTVLTNAHVARIVFRPGSSPLVATGVEFIHGDKTYVVQVKKEVIVSAGAFQTPQILELSGIGNKDILSKYGIETLVDLPGVGENLQDHPFINTTHEMKPEYKSVDIIPQEPALVAEQAELYKSKKGFFATVAAALYAFVPTKQFATDEQLQEWKEKAAKSAQAAPPGLKKQIEKQIEWLADPSSAEGEISPFAGFYFGSGLQPVPKTHYSSVICSISHPFSRGSVHIASADPKAPPAIDPNCLSNPLDLELLLGVLKAALKLYDTAPLRSSVVSQFCPTAEQSASDAALVEYIRNHCGCLYHPLGSAAMLPREDGGVVDPQLRVYGTVNVRVADASILPMEISTHIQATVYAVAEKAADIIKQSQT